MLVVCMLLIYFLGNYTKKLVLIASSQIRHMGVSTTIHAKMYLEIFNCVNKMQNELENYY